MKSVLITGKSDRDVALHQSAGEGESQPIAWVERVPHHESSHAKEESTPALNVHKATYAEVFAVVFSENSANESCSCADAVNKFKGDVLRAQNKGQEAANANHKKATVS
jgi:hypothetical protein